MREEVVSGFSFGLIFFLLALLGFFVGFGGFLIHSWVGLVTLVLMVVYFLLLAATSAAVRGMFTVALYRFATKGKVAPGFPPEFVERAFARKGARW